MANVNGKDLNSEFLKKIDAKINELYSDEGTIMASDLSEFLVEGEKKYILKGNQFFYNQLKELKRILSFSEIDEFSVLKFKNVAFKRDDETKFKEILNSSKFLRDEFVKELLEFNSVGYLPGYNGKVYAPFPRLDGQSIEDYEKYLKDYYASYNIYVQIDPDTGVRKPYPHETCQWENGVPRQGERNYRNQYYRDLVKSKTQDLDQNEENTIHNDQDTHSHDNAPVQGNKPIKKIKFKVKEKTDFRSFASKAGSAIMDAPDKLRNLDKRVGSDEFWQHAAKGIKRGALIGLGGILGGGLLVGLGAQFIGSFSTPAWVALGTGAGSGLAAGSVILGVAASVAPIIGGAALIMAYIKLRQRYLKRKKAAEELNEQPNLNDFVQNVENTNDNTNDLAQTETHDNVISQPVINPEPIVEPQISVPQQTAVPSSNIDDVIVAQQDPFLQLDSLVEMIKKSRDLAGELDSRRVTVESNGSPDAQAIMKDIDEKTKAVNEQIKNNLRNIADLCMSYNRQYDEVNNLSEGGMKL